jgi:hypothetical protein
MIAAACPRGDDVGVGPDGGVIKTQAAAQAKKNKPIDAEKYGAYMTRYPFGGRTTEWWSTRLTELKSGPAADPALYAFTLERAKANGLVVDDAGAAGAAVTVKPGPELTARLLERMELE